MGENSINNAHPKILELRELLAPYIKVGNPEAIKTYVVIAVTEEGLELTTRLISSCPDYQIPPVLISAMEVLFDPE